MERITLRDDDGRALLTPYGLRIYCSAQATADCICKLEEALQAQEPRVMTLEEVIDSVKGPVWFEGRSERVYRGWALVYDVQEGMGITGVRVGITEPGHITIWPSTELYGSKWRCWTSRPTDEQREATPWN